MVYCKEDSCLKQQLRGSDFCSENCKTTKALKALANKPSSNQFVDAPTQFVAAPRQPPLVVAAPRQPAPRQPPLVVAAPLTQPLVVAAPPTQVVAAPLKLTVANIKSISEFINAVTLGEIYPPQDEFLVKTKAILSSLLDCRETYADPAKKQQCIDEIIEAMDDIFIHFYGSASTSESVVYNKKIYTLEVAAAVYSMTRTLSAANIFRAQQKFIQLLEVAIKSVAGGKTENVSLPDKLLLDAYFAAIVAAIDKKIPSPEEKKVSGGGGGGVMKYVKLLVSLAAAGGVGYGYGLTQGVPVAFAAGHAAGQLLCPSTSSSPSQNISLSCNYNQAPTFTNQAPTFTTQDVSALEAVPTTFISELVDTVASGLAHVSGAAITERLMNWSARLALGTKLI